MSLCSSTVVEHHVTTASEIFVLYNSLPSVIPSGVRPNMGIESHLVWYSESIAAIDLRKIVYLVEYGSSNLIRITLPLHSKRRRTIGAGHITFKKDTNHERICRFCMEYCYVVTVPNMEMCHSNVTNLIHFHFHNHFIVS
jgi:hypothetical protein